MHDLTLIPLPLVSAQEPKSQPQAPTPAPGAGGPAPAGTTGSTGTPTGPGPGPGGACGGIETMWMLPVFLVLMWLLILRPESKRRKQSQQMMATLKAGDRVVTIGGVHGTVARLADKTITVRVDTIQMVIDRSAVARVERDEPPKIEGKG